MTKEEAENKAVKCAHCGNWFPVELQTGTHSSFKELFEYYDKWYWNRWRHHPPKMETGAFYEFLKKHNLIKETV